MIAEAALPTLAEIEAERCKRSLRLFVERAWSVPEPGNPFVGGWHIDCIAEHLEAVSAGQIRNLLVNIPPRHMKSLAVSVFWPCWEWARTPERRWLFASYALSLSVRDSLKCRRLIESAWYQERFGDVYQLTSDQNAKLRFENDRMGYRIATSVGGAATGEGGDVLVVDDPHNVQEAESDVIREGVLTWWDEVMATRGNDPRTVARVIVMQRTHEADLSGHVLERGGYHHLCLPARYEPRVVVEGGVPKTSEPQPHDRCEFATDPRVEPGESLWAERFGPDELATLERDLDTYAAAGQLQQRPVPRTGAMFASDYFRALPADFAELRPKLGVVQYWDLAFSEKASADYTAAVTLGIDQARVNGYVTNVYRERVAEADLVGKMAEHVLLTRPHLIGIEEGAYKQAATADLVRRLTVKLATLGVRAAIVPVKVTTDKVFRAQLPSGRGRAGMLFADRTAPWWQAFESELLKFPKGAHDDQVDALSGAVQLAIEAPRAREVRSVAFAGG